MLEITILPSGHLRCRCPGDGGDIYALERVAAVFARAGEGAGLVALAGLRTLEGLSMGAMFWRDFAGRFLRAFAAIAPETDAFLAAGGEDGAALADDLGGATPPPPPPETLRILLSAPPMLGAEYLTVSAFDGRWRAMDVWARERCVELGGPVAFFRAHAPQCPVAGKVCFHLAERREESQPFALLTSYAAGADRGGAPIR
ncbi:MAG: hypothetical protein J6333_02245, partial [Planctomycetes bacterium]|nr:hypothetical protein [Planctomycetota bacterium]